MDSFDFSTVEVVPCLPAIFPSGQGRPFPADLIGATILRIGTVSRERAVEGGGLVIDYRKPGGKTARRIILAFSEVGMWVAHQGKCVVPATQA